MVKISSFPASFSTHTHTASGHTYVHIHFGLEKFHGSLFNNLIFWDGSINVIFERCAPREWGPPDGWEPPGARSRKVDSLKKKRMKTLKRGPH